MLGQITGLRIIESAHCYTTKVVVRGIADSRRPNGKKPLYRRVVVQVPKMYRVGNDVICHPSLIPRIKQAFQQSVHPTAFSVPSFARFALPMPSVKESYFQTRGG